MIWGVRGLNEQTPNGETEISQIWLKTSSFLCPEDERKSYGSETTWKWVNDDSFHFMEGTNISIPNSELVTARN